LLGLSRTACRRHSRRTRCTAARSREGRAFTIP
jgi:hypothetical protein